jgi:hypothetical protein
MANSFMILNHQSSTREIYFSFSTSLKIFTNWPSNFGIQSGVDIGEASEKQNRDDRRLCLAIAKRWLNLTNGWSRRFPPEYKCIDLPVTIE